MVLAGVLLFLQFLLSCAEDNTDKLEKARFLVLQDGQYKEQDIALDDVPSWLKLKNKKVSVLSSSTITVAEDISLLGYRQLFENSGKPPKLDYKLQNKTLVPLNFETQAYLSVYYYFNQLMDWSVKNLELSEKDLGPAIIYMFPENHYSGDFFDNYYFNRSNAAFNILLNAFFIYETSDIFNVPFMIDSAVIAHEFGHSLFNYGCAQRNISFYDDDVLGVLRGIDEGLADFFAWVILGRSDIFLRSLGSERMFPVAWTGKDLSDLGQVVCLSGAYCWGSVLASSLYEATLASGISPALIYKKIFSSFSLFRETWNNKKYDMTIGEYLFLKDFLSTLDATQKPFFCQSFLKWFNDDINQSALQELCPS